MRAARALALLLGAAACAPDPGPPRAPAAFPVPPSAETSSLLLVTLDTFRADAAGCGGDAQARTPHLDRLARTGVQFENGLAATPITAPSHASILTGHNPPAHGVRDNGSFRLPGNVPTITERLGAVGFATGAFVGAFPLDARFGLSRGFDAYDDDLAERGAFGHMAMDQRDGGRVVAAFEEWLATTAPQDRRFAWVHLFDAHGPWDAPAPLPAACGGDGYRADVAYTDRWLGAAVRAARSRGDVWVVVLGDHGESLGEHQEATHSLLVYGSTLRIPAVVWPAPAGQRPGLRRATYRLIDFPATAVELLGLGPDHAPGTGVSGFAAADRPAYAESYYAFYHYGWAPLRAIQDGDWKYIEAPVPELYDVVEDPGESRNVAADQPDRVRALAARLEALSAGDVEASGPELDDEARRALESLGYVTERADPEPGAGTRPDPKSMVAVRMAIERAQALLAANQPEEAIQALRSGLTRDPKNRELHHLFGMAHAMAGRYALAVDSYRHCLTLARGLDDRRPRFELACAYVRLGEHEKAISHFEKVLEDYPGDADVWFNLGQAWDQLKNRKRAVEAWERALEVDPEHPLARTALGR